MELRLIGGGAALAPAQDQDREPYATVSLGHAAAATFGVGYQYGWFLGPHVQLGLAHSLARYEWLAKPDVERALGEDQWSYWKSNTSYTLFSPVGFFVEVHPFAGSGAFVGGSAAVALIPGDEQIIFGNAIYMAGCGLEVGYDMSEIKQGLGVLFRYASWFGIQSPFYSDFPAGLTSHELTVVGRLTFDRDE